MYLTRRRHETGFNLVEVAVTVSVFAILIALSVPAMTRWMGNVRVRSTADVLQNGLRLAQAESLRRSRRVVFWLTNSSNPQASLTANANGANWSINTIPSLTGETADFIESGTLTTTTAGVTITGPAAICFNSLGRLTANTNTGIANATCALPTGNPPVQSYLITLTTADRPLRIDVNQGGQVHMCDPAKTLSAANPDGCS